MRGENRCKIHSCFIGKDGCKICNEIAELKENHRLHTESMLKRIDELEAKELSVDVKNAVFHMTRNERNIAINCFGSQTILAGIIDFALTMPKDKQKRIQPLIDHYISIADQLSEINDLLAPQMIKAMGEKPYNNMIIDTIMMLDICSGKVKNCETCTSKLDHVKTIKQELKK